MTRAFLETLAVTTFVVAATSGLPAALSGQAQRPSDDTLKDRIEYRLETNSTLKKYDVDVKVANGVATLSGEVAAEPQKTDAARLARVEGIMKVENDIVVNKDVDRTLADKAKSGLSKTGEAINDAWITTKVKWFFTGEDSLKGGNINVETSNKVVTLKGTVKTAAGKARAIQLARDTEGVKNVVDQLTIGG